ncbi:hypothetical protein FOMPIDRAFT_89025 [Fomitopsis schrenkii]|uniref:Uncharacterized protein n=1 Tax=Fomitopsis schrenkii TaxID=2126942 RepID=S8EJ50_FOMSC|nr:hypothetical protein FOMPIDRAFT_89025 [Fomitopsis schrenkii]
MSTLEADLYFDFEAWDRYKSPVKTNAAHAATSSEPTSPSPATHPTTPSSERPASNVMLNFTLRYTPQRPSTAPVSSSAPQVAPPHSELLKFEVRHQPPGDGPVAGPSSSAGTKCPREDSTRTGALDTTPAQRPAKRARRDYRTHNCRWILDAGTCYFAGTSQQVWAHIREAHPRARQPIPEPQSDELPCNWNGCEHRGHPDSMRDHWIRTATP